MLARVLTSLQRRPARLIPIVSGLVFIVVLAQWPVAEQHRQGLLREFASITPVAGARELSTESGSKPVSAIATKTYGSLATQDVIAEHYKTVLGMAGWILSGERETTSGHESCFVRGDEAAALTIGTMSHPDWRYSISLVWRSFVEARTLP